MKIAAITCAYNESRFLPIWIKYYGDQLGLQNLFVIDDGSTPPIIHPDINVIRVPRSLYFSEHRKLSMLYHMQQLLFESYQVIIYSDVDEILVPDSAQYDGLVDFLHKKPKDTYTSLGIELIHNINQESAFLWHEPVLSQRKWCRPSSTYCKPLITRVGWDWTNKLHYAHTLPEPELDLFLLHLKFIDLQHACDRQQEYLNLCFLPKERDKNLSWHWRIQLSQFVKDNFLLNTSSDPIDLAKFIQHVISMGGINGEFDKLQHLHELPACLKKVTL